MSHAHTIQADRWEELVTNASRPVLIDFYADWCAPCRVLGPSIDAIAESLAGEIDVYKVDIEAAPELAGRFAVRSIPTLVLLEGGEERRRWLGIVPREELEKQLRGAITA